jgi:hypothetical protein
VEMMSSVEKLARFSSDSCLRVSIYVDVVIEMLVLLLSLISDRILAVKGAFMIVF